MRTFDESTRDVLQMSTISASATYGDLAGHMRATLHTVDAALVDCPRKSDLELTKAILTGPKSPASPPRPNP